MKTILVTGACGYIGMHVIDALVKRRDVTVIGIDVDVPDGGINSGVKYIKADFTSSHSWKDKLPCIPDVCLHLAWRNGFQHNNPSHMLDLSSHFAFLEHVMELGVPQIAVMGTMHEIGYWEGAVTDSTPCNPSSLYGISKNALRESFMLRAAQQGIKAQWIRGYYITGDDAGSQSIFGKLIRADKNGDTLFPFTSGKNKYDFLDVETLADQIASTVTQERILGIVNCCSGIPVSLGERVEDFIKENGLSIRLDYGAYPDRPYDSPGIWGDATKIHEIMNLLM